MKYTEKDLKKAKAVLITYPTMGTVYLEIKKVSNGFVEGLVWQEVGYNQFNMPEDYHGEYEYMNFPITCIKKIYTT